MLSKLYAIPEELRLLPNWCLWKYEWPNGKQSKPTKVPYQPIGYKCDVTNPSNWVKFDDAFNCLQLGSYDGLGFIFTNTGYAGIDLDDTSVLPNGEPNPNAVKDYERQLNIFKEFDSYSECSPSGKGLHIIVKGSVPQGRRRAFVEIYSSGRYFTMTGNVYYNKPIANRQELLQSLYEQMAAPPKISNYTGNEPETQNDAEIIQQASSASNGDKFNSLYSGDWQSLYSSQSEADFAIIDIIAFYTQNRNQIARIFRASNLGLRDKAKRSDYVNQMIQRSFDRMLPLVDTEGFKIALEEKLEQQRLAASSNGKTTAFDAENLGSIPNAASNGSVAQRLELAAHNGSVVGSSPATSTIPLPPGLLGEIAQFVYSAAPRPVPEIAIAAAIGLMSGICGRAYNVSGTGLNQYILLLAKTGRGKDAITSGIDKIMSRVGMRVPVADEFIGPEIINSGQALTRYISTQSNCFVSILGEFGFTIERISRSDANAADKMLYSNLLALYSRSGHGQVFKASIYSKKDDSVAATENPAVTILGESNPTTFYNCIDESMILAGLLPRFMTIEYDGDRKYLSENSHTVVPNEDLISKIATLCNQCKTLMRERTFQNVELDSEASKIMIQYDKETTDIINAIGNSAVEELWNRAHLKILKLAAVAAIGINPYNPIITVNELKWARPIVERDIKSLAAKFNRGEVGKNSEEVKQYDEFVKALTYYVTSDWEKIKPYTNGDVDHVLHSNKFITHKYLATKVSRLSVFKKDRIGATNALKRIVSSAVDNGLIVEVPRKEMVKYGKVSQKAYMIAATSAI